MTILFMQTADPHSYYEMLSSTSRTVRRYCLLNGFQYCQYIGIKRGYVGWQATYNRIFLLKELLDSGQRGWVFYLDADAYIEDMNFDLSEYLSDKRDCAAIFSGHLNGIPYSINAGGFAVNLDHPSGRSFVFDYYAMVQQLGLDKIDQAIFWERDVMDDQDMMFRVLKYYNDIDALRPFIFEKTNFSYVNDGPFIKQSLRSHFASDQIRRSHIISTVEKIMEAAPNLPQMEGSNVASLPSTHPRLLTETGMKTAFGIYHDGATSGAILYGPYVNIDSGVFNVMIDLRISRITEGTAEPVTIDVVADHGRRQIFNISETLKKKGYFSLGFSFEAAGGAENMEIRVHAPAGVTFFIIGVRVTRVV